MGTSTHRHDDDPRDRGGGPLGLDAAFASLNALLLARPDQETFLHEVEKLAAALLPGSRCSVTLRRDEDDRASRNLVAVWRDEERGRTGDAPARDSGPEVSLPLAVNGRRIGTLDLVSSSGRAFTESEVRRARAFARQAATTYALLLRLSEVITLDEQLQEALRTRAHIDQALGILMHARGISSRQAFEVLRHASQSMNRRVSDIAADLILTMTGHPPEPPRPLTRRDTHHRGEP